MKVTTTIDAFENFAINNHIPIQRVSPALMATVVTCPWGELSVRLLQRAVDLVFIMAQLSIPCSYERCGELCILANIFNAREVRGSFYVTHEAGALTVTYQWSLFTRPEDCDKQLIEKSLTIIRDAFEQNFWAFEQVAKGMRAGPAFASLMPPVQGHC